MGKIEKTSLLTQKKMILEYVAEMINASMVSKFRDNRPKERGGEGR